MSVQPGDGAGAASALAEFHEPHAPLPARVRGYMFDVDGTLLLSDRSLGGYELLPGAAELLTELKRRSIPFVLLTNGSAYVPAEQAEKLRRAGLPVDDEQMLTPSSVAAALMRRHRIGRVLVLGTPGVGHSLREAGITTLHTGEPGDTDVDAVYVGWYPQCAMPDIEAATNAILAGAKLYVASNVPFFATRHGRTPGYSYAIVAAIRSLTRAPMILTGKPSLQALRFVASRLRLPMEAIAVVGDDPIVEALMAHRGGAYCIGVTTGTTSHEEWHGQSARQRPDRIVGGLPDLLRAIRESPGAG